MLDKVDVRPIVRAHFASLEDYATEKTNPFDFVLFFACPAALAAVAVWQGFRFTSVAVNGLLTAFSIFAGLLLSLLVMVFSFAQSTQGTPGDVAVATRRRLLRQINANLSFSILLSVAMVLVAIVALANVPDETKRIHPVASFLLVAGTVSFSLTLMMVIKRMYFLMTNELDRQKARRSA